MSSVTFDSGFVTIVCSEVLVVGLVVKHMPDGDEQLAGHCYEDFHLVLLSDLRLVEGEAAEEAVLCPACSRDYRHVRGLYFHANKRNNNDISVNVLIRTGNKQELLANLQSEKLLDALLWQTENLSDHMIDLHI